MQVKLRSTLALAIAVSVLAISAVAAARTPSPPVAHQAIEDSGGSGDGGGSGDPFAMCMEGVPDCNDTPGYPIGDGTDPSGGGGSAGCDPTIAECDPPVAAPPSNDDPCGVAITQGSGPDGTVSYEPCPGEEPVPTEPTIVEPTPGMANVYARPFDNATVGDDGRTVTIDFVSGIEPCYVLDHIDVAYGPNAVTIALFEGNDPSAGDVVCIEIGVFKTTVIALDEPLDGRVIVDGAAA